MNHPLAVRSGEPVGDSQAESEHPLPRQRLAQGGQILAGYELRDDVQLLVDLADSVDTKDVGVLDSGGGARLDEELLAQVGIGLQGAEELDGDLAVEQDIVSQVDLAHAAPPELPHQSVLSKGAGREALSGRVRRGRGRHVWNHLHPLFLARAGPLTGEIPGEHPADAALALNSHGFRSVGAAQDFRMIFAGCARR